jgi:hypothetical protein
VGCVGAGDRQRIWSVGIHDRDERDDDESGTPLDVELAHVSVRLRRLPSIRRLPPSIHRQPKPRSAPSSNGVNRTVERGKPLTCLP